jgi:hypothetical protein
MVQVEFTVGRRASATHTAQCRGDRVLVGGGVRALDRPTTFETRPLLLGSGPVTDTTWETTVSNPSLRSYRYVATIFCASRP